MIKILIASHDPGGANALIPVAKKLLNSVNIELLIYCSGYSESIFRNAGFDAIIIEDRDYNKIESEIVLTNPDRVLTGISAVSRFEADFWTAAKKYFIPSFAIVDNWGGYKARFQFNNKYEYPDKIFVLDELCLEEFIKVGIPSEKMKVVGNPHFESLAEYKPERTFENFVSNFALSNKKIITFISD